MIDKRLIVGVACVAIFACTPKSQEPQTKIWPKVDVSFPKDEQVQQRVDTLLSSLTLEQKVAQVIQPEIRDVTIEDMRKYGFGSYLNGGGAFPNNNKHASVDDWVALAEAMYQASIDDSLDGTAIPTMWGTDAVHGHNNVVGATLFPHNIGLGAMRNPELMRQIANATAKEVMATGIDWIFAPTVAVARDDRWGRTYESYSEDPSIVKAYAGAVVNGLQGGLGDTFLDEQHVISTVKHFVGDGGTEKGDDQGNNLASEADLYRIHAQGYVSGLAAGAQSVMASFNSWQGEKIHGSRYLLTDVLKEKMGFQGFVVGDWNGHGQIPGCTNDNCPQAMNAGLDVYMVPTQAWKPLYYNLIEQVKSGVIPMARLDDAVRRVLAVKVRAGLFDKPSPQSRPLSGDKTLIGHPQHRDIARQAVRESLVLLKNKDRVLPIQPNQHVLIVGDGADNIGKQSGGWTITWQGTGNQNSDFPGATSIYAGLKAAIERTGGTVSLSVDGRYSEKPDVVIAVFGEEPYAEGNGDLDNLDFERAENAAQSLLNKVNALGAPVVSVFITGRPLWVNPELNRSDAFVVAWLPGSEGAGIADVLVADQHGHPQHDFKGTLPFSWPAHPEHHNNNVGQPDYAPLLPFGFGLGYTSSGDDLATLNEALPVAFESQSKETQHHQILGQGAQAPWKAILKSGGESVVMTSNVESLNALTVRTSDRLIQEDALSLTWAGNTHEQLQFFSPFPVDLRRHGEAEHALVFTYRWLADTAAVLTVTMGCDSECVAAQEVNIAPSDSWASVAIPLACFTEKGLDLKQIYSPFTLSTNMQGTLDIHNVYLGVSKADTVQLTCQ
ncbi:putative glycoside hydrolase [Aestuariibacter sp. AA17]|uniref:Glycoside hydrolase n=1 Tax=Fluctibacter corallii TaxID=2984329 RepID=A0ABT3ABC4_9ALTE|nr:glycoside hydrolase family 3 N-terminal domain-containing protein [Aestuariibacter sp. AA17]MCV2885928.1 putative glycoside hydrolase [Aestuariibacter sp. AA17]